VCADDPSRLVRMTEYTMGSTWMVSWPADSTSAHPEKGINRLRAASTGSTF